MQTCAARVVARLCRKRQSTRKGEWCFRVRTCSRRISSPRRVYILSATTAAHLLRRHVIDVCFSGSPRSGCLFFAVLSRGRNERLTLQRIQFFIPRRKCGFLLTGIDVKQRNLHVASIAQKLTSPRFQRAQDALTDGWFATDHSSVCQAHAGPRPLPPSYPPTSPTKTNLRTTVTRKCRYWFHHDLYLETTARGPQITSWPIRQDLSSPALSSPAA